MSSNARSTPAPRDLRWVLGLVGFCTFLGLYSVQALLPMFRVIFHATEAQVSLSISAATAAVAIAAPLVGLLADRWERRPVILAALVALAVTTLLAAVAPNLPLLVAARFIQGLFVPLAYVVTLSYIKESCDPRAIGASTAAFVAGNVLGGFTGRALSGALVEPVGWQVALGALGVIGLVGAGLAAKWLPHPRCERPAHLGRAGFAQWGRLLRMPVLVAILAAGFNTLFVQVAMFTYVNFHLAAPPYGLHAGALAGIFTVYLLGMVVTPQAGKLIDRHGYRAVFLTATATALSGVLLTLVPSLAAVIAGLAVCATGVFICQSAATSSLGGVAGKAHSIASGLYLCAYYIGGSVGGQLPGALWDWGGWNACVGLVAVMQLITLGVVWAFWPRRTAAVPAPEAQQPVGA